MKKCSKCKIIKLLDEFHKDNSQKSGYKSQCKECLKYHHRKYKKQTQSYRIKNKSKINKLSKKWRKNNPEKCKEYYTRYTSKNKDKLRKRRKMWAEENQDYFKNYKQNNKRQHSEYMIKYNKKKREEDPLFKLKCNLRNRVRIALKSKKLNKNNKLLNTIGCSLDELKLHIEKQFTKGMTWDNYGEWHIDHIIPLYTGKTEEEIYKLNHYSNLQPLWAYDHFLKTAKENIKRVKNE